MTALLSACLPQTLLGFGLAKVADSEPLSSPTQADVKLNRDDLTALFSDILSEQDIRRAS